MLERLEKSEYAARVAWLRRYQDAMRKQRQLAQRLAEARSDAIKITPAYQGVHSQSRNGASAEELAIERIEDARLRLLDHETACKALYAETLRAILTVEDAKEREVLRRRYLHGQGMDRVAEEMDIASRHARRLHRQAIYSVAVDMSALMC